MPPLPAPARPPCPECDGAGTVEVADCHNRGPWPECCGGCTKLAPCRRCGGAGELAADSEDLEPLRGADDLAPPPGPPPPSDAS